MTNMTKQLILGVFSMQFYCSRIRHYFARYQRIDLVLSWLKSTQSISIVSTPVRPSYNTIGLCHMYYVSCMTSAHVLRELYDECTCTMWVVWRVHMYYMSCMTSAHVLRELYDECTCTTWVVWRVHMYYVSCMMSAHVLRELYDECTCTTW